MQLKLKSKITRGFVTKQISHIIWSNLKKYGSILNMKFSTEAQSDTPDDHPIRAETCHVNIIM
jgi:hypothetical protein